MRQIKLIENEIETEDNWSVSNTILGQASDVQMSKQNAETEWNSINIFLNML